MEAQFRILRIIEANVGSDGIKNWIHKSSRKRGDATSIRTEDEVGIEAAGASPAESKLCWSHRQGSSTPMTPRLLWWGLMWESQPEVVIDNELSAIKLGIASSSNVNSVFRRQAQRR